jgi:hypothetical protein
MSVAVRVALISFMAGSTVSEIHALQLTRGYISGVVSDPSGAVAVGVRVKVRNSLTDQGRETTTNDSGVFRIVAVEPGLYEVVFAAPGFATRRITNVRVSIASETVLNESLSIEPFSATIEVLEANGAADLAKATISVLHNHSRDSLESAPLTASFRDLTRLSLLAPATVRGPNSSEIAANGQRTRQNNFVIDGTNNNDASVTGPNARLIPEAISDLQVQLMPYSVEYGRTSGAQVMAVTRSGSSAVHGEVWDYYRANWMEPVSILNKRAGLNETPRFVQHQAGASVGGPLAKRTFAFGLLEANQKREAEDARNSQSAVIPTPKGFSDLISLPLGVGQDSLSRRAALDALSFLKDIYPLVTNYENITDQTISGTQDSALSTVQVGTIRIPIARPQNAWLGFMRIDHTRGESTSLSYRGLFDRLSQDNVASNRQFGSRFAAGAQLLIQNHSATHTQIFGSNITNELRLAYIRSNLQFPENDPTSPTINIARGALVIGGLSTFPQGRLTQNIQWQNITSFQSGRHALKLGIDLEKLRVFNRAAFDSKGSWTFDTLSDFLNNRASLLRQVVSDASYDAGQIRQAYFFQDDYKLGPQLTLSGGIRYDLASVPLGFFGAPTREVAAAGVPLPTRPDSNNWASRFAFAYSPSTQGGLKAILLGNQQTVLRGGFGMAYDLLFFNILTVTANNPTRVVRFDTRQPETINLFPKLAPNRDAGVPFDPTADFINVPSDTQAPTVHFWSLAIQRHFATNFLIEVGYTGNRSYHLLRQSENNPAILSEGQAQTAINGGAIPSIRERRLNPSWGARATIESTALSEYHGLFTRIDRRMAGGLLVAANYTWSATFSDNDEPLAIGVINSSSPVLPQSYFDYRNDWSRSIFDRPHRITVQYSYDFPITRGYLRVPMLGYLLADWKMSGYVEWQSGQPFTVRTGVDSGGSGVSTGLAAWRPDLNPDGIFRKDPVEGDLRTFSTPIDGTGLFLTPLRNGSPLPNSMPAGGNLGRNTLRGPSFTTWNLSLTKRIPLSERIDVMFRGDFFNLWNHRNFGNPDAVMSNATVGTFGTNSTDPSTRTMLLALKVLF